MEGNGWKWIGWQKRLETPYHIMTTYYQVLERDGKVSELDQRTDALQVDFVWYNAIVQLCAYPPQNNQKSDHFSDCNILIIFTRREQANSGGTPRRLKTREGEEVEVMKWKNHVFSRWESWKLTVIIGVVVALIVVLIIVLAVLLAPAS